MTDFNQADARVQELVLKLQEDARTKAQMILETAALINGEEPFPPGSDADYTFRSGVEAGMSATMQALHDRGWIRIAQP